MQNQSYLKKSKVEKEVFIGLGRNDLISRIKIRKAIAEILC